MTGKLLVNIFAEQENNEQWVFLKEKSTKANIPPYKVDISSWRKI